MDNIAVYFPMQSVGTLLEVFNFRFSAFSFQNSPFTFHLSALSNQLSAISYKQSAISFQLALNIQELGDDLCILRVILK